MSKNSKEVAKHSIIEHVLAIGFFIHSLNSKEAANKAKCILLMIMRPACLGCQRVGGLRRCRQHISADQIPLLPPGLKRKLGVRGADTPSFTNRGRVGLSCKANDRSDARTGDLGVLPTQKHHQCTMTTVPRLHQATASLRSDALARPGSVGQLSSQQGRTVFLCHTGTS